MKQIIGPLIDNILKLKGGTNVRHQVSLLWLDFRFPFADTRGGGWVLEINAELDIWWSWG